MLDTQGKLIALVGTMTQKLNGSTLGPLQIDSFDIGGVTSILKTLYYGPSDSMK